MDSKQLAIAIAQTLNEKKAQDIIILDIGEKSGFADYFVIADAGNARLIEALADYAEDSAAKEGQLIDHREGTGDSGWVLMDFGSVIVNLFTLTQREHYNLEKVWADCIAVEF